MSKNVAKWFLELPNEEKEKLLSFFNDYNNSRVKRNLKPIDFLHLRLDLVKNILENIKRGEDAKAKFRLFSKEVADSYYKNGKWSSLEVKMKQMLESLGLAEKEDYWHNFKLENPSQTHTYELDFFLPNFKLVIECDGKIWHGKMGDVEEKDKVRDDWLRTLGFKVLRFTGDEIQKEPETVLKNIERTLKNQKSGIELTVSARLLNNGKEARNTFTISGKSPYSCSLIADLLHSLSNNVIQKLNRRGLIYGYSSRARERA